MQQQSEKQFYSNITADTKAFPYMSFQYFEDIIVHNSLMIFTALNKVIPTFKPPLFTIVPCFFKQCNVIAGNSFLLFYSIVPCLESC